MDNGIDWPTWIQALTSVLAILLAVFMPGILKAVERRDSALAIVRIFKLSIREVHNHVVAMGTVLQRRLENDPYPQNVKAEVFTIVIGKLGPMVKSQFDLMRSVTAVDLPVPGMAVMPSMLESSVEMLKDAVEMAIEEDMTTSGVFAKYQWHRDQIHDLIKECDETLTRIENDLSPHPVVQIFKGVVARLRNIN